MIANFQKVTRFARDAGYYLRLNLTLADCREVIRNQQQNRNRSFLRILKDAIYEQPASPYRALLRQADLDYETVSGWVQTLGVEGALARLYDAGVYLTLAEFKGRQPIRRPGLDLAVSEGDFDNGLATGHYSARSGGSRSAGRRMIVDLELLRHESAYDLLFFEASASLARPKAIWRPLPPGSAGLKAILRYTMIGQRLERWFTQTRWRISAGHLKYYLFTHYVLLHSRWIGRPMPWPQFAPPAEAETVARWLAQKKAAGTPAYLNTNVGSMVRVCLSARDHNLDISETLFRVGGEPLTPAKLQLADAAGVQVRCHYNMSEVGRLGAACTDPAAPDDVHLTTDKVAILQRPVQLGTGQLPGLFCTTLHPSTPKLMLNVELGDYGVVSERACGCPLGQLGLSLHLHTIRNYEKLTTEGMHFLGSEFLTLVDETLPARFGGHPNDYQFVEEEHNGLSKVSVVISPRVGPVDEPAVIATILQALGSLPGGSNMMADYWRQGETLQVTRREPYLTSAAKVQALHVIQK